MVDVSKRRKGKIVAGVEYLDLPSSITPIPHCSKFPVPLPPVLEEVHKYSDEEKMDAEDLGHLPEVSKKFLTSLIKKKSMTLLIWV